MEMATEGLDRKLKAIFSADVRGYSKLMADNDELTVNTIIAYREIIGALIEKYQGRVVDAPGDNILAEFASPLNAVKSAIEIQKAVGQENEQLPSGRGGELPQTMDHVPARFGQGGLDLEVDISDGEVVLLEGGDRYDMKTRRPDW